MSVKDELTHEYLRPDEVAAILRTSRDALAVLRQRGGGPAYLKVGPRKIFYRRSDVEAFLNADRVVPGSAPTGSAA